MIATPLPEPRDVPAVLGRLEIRIVREVPLHPATLPPGVSEADLNAFEARSHVTLPPDLRALYRWHDGGDQLGLSFLSLIHLDCGREAALAADCMTDLDEIIVSHPPGALWPMYALRDWLPCLHEGSGNHVALDLKPEAAGRVGQVITTGLDEDRRFVLVPEVHTFLRECLRRLNGFQIEAWQVRFQEIGGRAPEGYGVLADLFLSFGAPPTHTDTGWYWR